MCFVDFAIFLDNKVKTAKKNVYIKTLEALSHATDSTLTG